MSFDSLLRVIGSGNSPAEAAPSNLDALTAEIMQPMNNGFHDQIVPTSKSNATSALNSNHGCNGYGLIGTMNTSNPAFSDCNGQWPGVNPFADEQIPDDVQAFNAIHLPATSNYSNGSGLLFNTAPDPPRTGELDRADSDSLSWLDGPPPPEVPINTPATASTSQPPRLPQYQQQPFDPVEAAYLEAGIEQHPTVQPSGMEQQPIVQFVRQPADVQFRYRKELDKGTVSPIWADGGARRYPAVQISNVPPRQTYRMELLLLNEKRTASVHKFYQTKPLNAEKDTFSYPVTHDQTIDLENIGVLRAPSNRRGDNELHNSVILGVRLLTQHGWEAANCQSKEILDLKKTKLRIDHINPQYGFNSSTQKEVTILCSKISEDTEVIFEHGSTKRKAELVLKHHGCALVVRPPTFPKQRESFQARVRLHCRSRNRFSEPKFYEYKVDPLDSIDTAAFSSLHAGTSRDRSPLRHDASLVLDGLATDFEQMKLKSRETIAECDNLVAALSVKMADLEKIRDVACGREAWSEEASAVLGKAPYILHVQDNEGFTPPMRALLSGETRIFEQLLSSVPSAEQQRLFSARTCGGATLLHLLAIPAQVPRPLLQMMLDCGADPLKTDENGQTMVHWLVRKQRVSLLKISIDCLEQFFRQRGDAPKAALHQLLDRLDSSGQSAIHCAVLSSAIGAIDVLVTSGCSVDLRCPNSGLTALHWAIIENNAQAVEALIARGASVHAETNWGAAALDIARQSRETQPGILQALREAGASKGSCRSSEEED